MRKTFDEVEEFLKNNKLDESDDGGFWFYSQDEKTYLLIIFDWDKMYDSIYYVYEPEKITVDPYFSNPASEEFDYTFDKTMVREVRWVDESLENEIKLALLKWHLRLPVLWLSRKLAVRLNLYCLSLL